MSAQAVIRRTKNKYSLNIQFPTLFCRIRLKSFNLQQTWMTPFLWNILLFSFYVCKNTNSWRSNGCPFYWEKFFCAILPLWCPQGWQSGNRKVIYQYKKLNKNQSKSVVPRQFQVASIFTVWRPDYFQRGDIHRQPQLVRSSRFHFL